MLFYYLLILLQLSLILAQEINSQDYIWLQYGRIQPKQYDQNLLLLKIPCQTRIGSCSYDYKIVPPGWTYLANGNLLIPKTDLTGIRTYALKINLKEPTGQKIDANLIIDVQNSQVKMLDQTQFYSNLSYQPNLSSILNPRLQPNADNIISQATSNSKPVNNSQTVTPSTPQSIIPVSQVTSILRSGDAAKISQTINKLIGLNLNCNDKIKYLTLILQEIRIQKQKNDGKIQLFNNQVKTLKQEIDQLNLQKNALLKNQSNNQDLKQVIKALEARKKQAGNQQKKYEQIANNYFIAIKSWNQKGKQVINNSATDDKSLVFDERELQMIDQAIKQLQNRKFVLESSINQKKYQKELSNLKNLPPNIDSLEENYRQYSTDAIKAKIEADRIKNQIQALKNKQTNLNSDTMIEQAISKLESEIEERKKLPDGRKIEDVTSYVEILQNSLNNIKKDLANLEGKCVV